MRRPFDAIRKLREPEERKPMAQIRISRSPSPFKDQSFPKLERSQKLKKEPSAQQPAENDSTKRGYLALHQEKQATRQLGFFLVKKKDQPAIQNQAHCEVFDTPRFGEQSTPSEDFIRFNINSESTTCHSQDLISWVSQTMHQKSNNLENLGLTFADRVESSFVNCLPPGRMKEQGNSSKPNIPIRRFLLPAIEPVKGHGGIRYFSEDRLSKSLDFRPQSDGRSAPKIIVKRSELLQITSPSKPFKLFKKTNASKLADTCLQEEITYESNKIRLQRKGIYELSESLNTPPSFGCMDSILKYSKEQSLVQELEETRPIQNKLKNTTSKLSNSFCLDLAANK
jgi:hypothetical protein